MNTPNIEKLLVRYYNDELPFDQTARVAAWIAASEENRKIAEQIYYICFAAETQDAKAALDTAGALRKVKGRIRAENGAGHSGRSSARPPSCCCPWSACRPIC